MQRELELLAYMLVQNPEPFDAIRWMINEKIYAVQDKIDSLGRELCREGADAKILQDRAILYSGQVEAYKMAQRMLQPDMVKTLLKKQLVKQEASDDN